MMRQSSLSFSILGKRPNVFYLLALVPLVLVAYYNYVGGRSILGVFVPLYSFLLLLFKRDRLFLFSAASSMQRFAGITAIVLGLFTYSAVIQIYPSTSYEAGAIFYGLYIIGLFLAFFRLPALKESASAVFLAVAGGSSFVLGEWLEFYMEPWVPQFVWIMVRVLGVLGIPVADYGLRWILLNAPRGAVPVSFEAGCIGIESFLVFAVLMVVTMLEESASVRTKVLWAVLGVIGTFLVNILRVSMIAVVIYYFGYERWGEIHSWIGYAMFLAWLGVFFAVFSKREAIAAKMRLFLQRF